MTNATLSDQTCGDACWKAREDTCRCSCGGTNHGIAGDGGQGERTCRVDGYTYKLIAIVPDDGRHAWKIAAQISASAIAESSMPDSGKLVYDGPLCYAWRSGDRGIPAFERRVAPSAMNWAEIKALGDCVYRPFAVWGRVDIVA